MTSKRRKGVASKQKEWFLYIPQLLSFDNGTDDRIASNKATSSIEAIMDTNLDDGFKSRIKEVSVRILATSATYFWVKPILIDTAAVITGGIDDANRSQENLLNAHVAGSFGRTNLTPNPLYAKLYGADGFSVETTIQIPQRDINLINSRLEEPNPTEESSLFFMVWIQTQTNPVYLYFTTCIHYNLELNQSGR